MRPPSWDLLKVLRFWSSGSFEPLRAAPLLALSKKVLFLLALATAKRVGELQAFSHIVSFVGGDACLSYVPEFVAKSESLSRSIPRSFLVKSLSDFAEGLDVDLLLCPVRALRVSLDRTLSLAPSRRRLFVSPSSPTRAMSKNAVSFLLRVVIPVAAASRPEWVRSMPMTRGVSASVAFHCNWSVSAVLDAATWSSSSVFTSFYLRALQHEFQGLRSLGSFMDRVALTSSHFAMGEEEVLCRPCPRCSAAPRPVFSYWLWWRALPVPVRVLGFPVLLLFSYIFIVCSLYVYFIYLYYACPSLNGPVGLCFWTRDMTSDWLPSVASSHSRTLSLSSDW